jgi:D-alanine--poly(phosphoribitol) ligase subunit 2
VKAAPTERVTTLFTEVLRSRPPGPDVDLLETGLLDSLALIELILALELEFSIELPLEDIDIERFRTLETIAALVAERTALDASDAA